MKIIEINKFNQKMIQLGVEFCIPASVQAIIQYHDPSFSYSQSHLLSLMVIGEQNHQPSFGAVERHILPIVQKQFIIKVLNPLNFQDW